MDATWPSVQRRINGSPGAGPNPVAPLVALIEDDPDVAEMTGAYLRRTGFRVVTTADARTGIRVLARDPVDLVVLDLGLPDGSGLDLLRDLREGGLHGAEQALPVVIMTAWGAETERVVGLELGADDYLVKPVSLPELAARVRAVLRRAQPAGPPGRRRVGQLVLDTDAQEVSVAGGDRLALRPLEYGLLAALAAAPRRVLSAQQLLEQVWGSTRPDPGTVAEHVYRIRRTLAAAGVERPRLVTVRGSGYRLDP